MLTVGVNVDHDCKDLPRFFDVLLVTLRNDNHLRFKRNVIPCPNYLNLRFFEAVELCDIITKIQLRGSA